MASRYFTLEEAEALLPRVRRSMGQALQLHGHLRALIARIDATGHEVSWPMLRREAELDDAEPEVQAQLERARMLYTALRETIAEVEADGVVIKGVLDGLVDFHSWLDGNEEVLLCWKLGEPGITWFHGLDDGFAGRRPVKGHRFTNERELPARSEA